MSQVATEKARIGAAVAVLAEAYRQKVSVTTLTAYEWGLAGLTGDQVEQAVGEALRTKKFMPSPAELRELTGEMSPHDRGLIAWHAVLKAVSAVGSYSPVDFADRTVNAVIRNLGGWPTFCGRLDSAESEKWLRKEFIDTYAAFAKRSLSDDACRPLSGIAEKTVRNGVLCDPVPRLVGVGGDVTHHLPAPVAAAGRICGELPLLTVNPGVNHG